MNTCNHKIRKNNGLNFLLLLMAFLSINSIYSQQKKKKNSIYYCFEKANLMIKGLGKNDFQPIKRGELFLNNFTIKDTSYFFISDKLNHSNLSLRSNYNEIDEWNDIVDWDKSKFYYSPKGKYLIATSSVIGVSGLETNFFKWIVINLESGKYLITQSLSDNPKYFFVEKEEIIFYLFDYSAKFLSIRDFDKLSLSFKKYSLNSLGDSKKINDIFLNCDCK